MSTTFETAYASAQHVLGKVNVLDLGRVSRKDFQRFAFAIDDLNPRYLDENEARAHGFPDVVAPPIYLSGVMGWEPGPAEWELRPDGTGRTETAGLPLEGLRLMGAGQELEFHHPVTDGLHVKAHVSLDRAELKQGRSGQLLLLRILRRFVDGDGRELITCRESFIAR